MEGNIKILFMCVSSKKNAKGHAPIYVRITVRRRQVHLSTGEYIDPGGWDVKTGRVRGRGRKASMINLRLDEMYNRIIGIRNDLEQKDEEVTVEAIKLIMTGKADRKKKLLEVFALHNLKMKSLIGNGYSQATCDIFKRSKDEIETFIKHEYGKDDFLLSQLNEKFAADYDFYLRTVKGNDAGTVFKKVQRLNKIVDTAVRYGWLDRNRLKSYEIKRRKKEIIFLTEEELNTLLIKDISIERLDVVRDVFVFCCYTGLGYQEVRNLSLENITKGIDKENWIIINRHKTGKDVKIPILPKAQELIDKYRDHPMSLNIGKIFPVLSNQKMNAYLKEIQTICGIEKELTTHVARKTFATTVTLLNDVPMETVSELLGHSSLRITQEAYAKVVDKKISRDMKALSEKLKTNGNETN
jgi:integrase